MNGYRPWEKAQTEKRPMTLLDIATELETLHGLYIDTAITVRYDTPEEMAHEAAGKYREVHTTLGLAIRELEQRIKNEVARLAEAEHAQISELRGKINDR